MRALSLWQPWASLIAYGAKRWETRSWGTDYRGALMIHAAKRRSPPIDDPRFVEEAIQVLGHADFNALPGGKVVAVCEITACHRVIESDADRAMAADYGDRKREDLLRETYGSDLDGGIRELRFGDWSVGRYVWKLERVRRLHAPIALRGRQKLWEVDAWTIGELAIRLARSTAV